MPLSYKNLLNAVTSEGSNVSRKSLRTAKYIKGYVDNTAIEALANSLNINKGLFRQVFGLEEKELDAYDPYHISDAKGEEFWLDSNNNEIDGKRVQSEYDEDTNTFKRGLYTNPELGGYGQTDFWYEDPFVPNFELFFDDESPLFNGDDQFNTQSPYNTIKNFMQRYEDIDPLEYQNRFTLWVEFKKIFFKIFEKELKGDTTGRNRTNKSYYITKIQGLNNLNKKIIKYGEDKITITINEDVSMFAWYLAELYKNLVYSYKNQRFAFPENAIRFNMTIKINEMRNYQIPQSGNNSSPNIPNNDNYLDNKKIKNIISPKSEIFYTLHDCTFDFFESRNYNDELEIGGYGVGSSTTPQTLSFDIYFKSVTHSNNFPLILNSVKISPWDDYINYNLKVDYFNQLTSIKQETTPVAKGYLNKLLSKAKQTVVNQGLNYLDNLETKLREVRGSAVNDLLLQFRDLTQINKIEPDNVYNTNFNDRTNLGNFGKSLGSSLLNDLEETIRNAANF